MFKGLVFKKPKKATRNHLPTAAGFNEIKKDVETQWQEGVSAKIIEDLNDKLYVIPLIEETIDYAEEESEESDAATSGRVPREELRTSVERELADLALKNRIAVKAEAKKEVPEMKKEESIKVEVKKEKSENEVKLERESTTMAPPPLEEDPSTKVKFGEKVKFEPPKQLEAIVTTASQMSTKQFLKAKCHGLYVPKRTGKRKRETDAKSMLATLLRRKKKRKEGNIKESLDRDIASRPVETNNGYVVPVEEFGVAYLRGTGWKPGDKINGAKTEVVEPHAVRRNAGIGAKIKDFKSRKPLKPGQKLPYDVRRPKEIEKEKKEKARKLLAQAKPPKKKKKKRKKKIPVTWVRKRCIVRVVDEDSKYYRKKGQVLDVFSPYDFTLEMLGSRDIIETTEDKVDTVIPKIHENIVIVAGKMKGMRGILQQKHKNKEKATILLDEDLITIKLKYEEICSVK